MKEKSELRIMAEKIWKEIQETMAPIGTSGVPVKVIHDKPWDKRSGKKNRGKRWVDKK